MDPNDIPAHPEPSSVPKGVSPEPNLAGAPAPLDAAVLERVRQRDPEALGLLYERYFDRVFGLVHRLLGDRTMAEDAVSEVFLKVHRAADRLDPQRDPGAWLMTIATNVCRDLWRSGAYRMGRRASDVQDEAGVGGRLSSNTPGPEGELLGAERERLVQEALAELPEQLRIAVVLHDWEGLSHQEVADRTGIEHAAARKRYSRAITALGRLLKERLR